jgi:hypothetical protein
VEADVDRTMRGILYGASEMHRGRRSRPLRDRPRRRSSRTASLCRRKLPAWLTEEDAQFFVNEFKRTGFRGGLNWYRNLDGRGK